LRYENKAREEHGTQVTVTKLREDMVTRLRSTRAVRDTMVHLGRIYTYMLRDPQGGHSGAELMGGAGQRLYVNERAVAPHLPCIWDPSRSVIYKGAAVPAATAIEIPLTNAYACMNCGRWYTTLYEKCIDCESSHIEERERQIRGWLGIQRFADKSDFGLTFLRHGRAITYQDKSLFNWETPDGNFELEYPIELGMGRIVGEIHLDHAPVNVRKTNFDTSSQEWRFMVEKVRGPEPLRPKHAMRLVGHENSSPMSSFFNAYRENKPGLRYLVPGNGETSIHEQAKAWAAKFRDGDPEYLTDEKWFQAAADHDRIKDGPPPEPKSPTDDDDWLEDEGLGHLGGGEDDSTEKNEDDPAPEPEPLKPETREERFGRYRASAVLIPDTDREVRIGASQPVLRVYVTSGVELTEDGQRRPYAIQIVGGEIEVYVDAGTSLIAHYGWSPMNVALVCAAPQLKNVYSVDGSIDELVTSILDQFPDRRVDAAAVRARADTLLDDMRDRLADLAPKDPTAYWSGLSGESRRAAESAAVSVAPDIDWNVAVDVGDFARYVTASGVLDLVQNSPTLVLDGALFRTTYASLGEQTQLDQVARVGALLADLRRMTAAAPTRPVELARLMLTADLLDEEIVTG
jgi:hypothetical protein